MADVRETVWLTIKEYATTRKVSVATVRRQIAAGKLTADKLSPRCVRIRLTRVVTERHRASGEAQP